ncbi:MAG: DUF1501 domain-containing protein [Candidatus Hydrogenedentes bacterium]|nr:DUF1501 domain-containing protein [Candidatus Hydrogenedentota bacterium]
MDTNREARGISRRSALKHGLLSAAMLGTHGIASGQPSPGTAKAKSVIQIWMWGGPSHLDTFDPKPGAGHDYCGALDTAIATNADGVQINGALPMLAKQADKYSIIRSMTHGINAHETASYASQTGREPGRLVFPSVGAVVSMFKGVDQGYKGVVPPYIVLTQPQGRFSEAGFLGQKHKPFATGGDPNRDPFAVEGIIFEGLTDERQRRRRKLLHMLDTLGVAMPLNSSFQRFDECEDNAYDLMFGSARRLFDLREEKKATRERYGRNTFGQSCLMARRLVEEGVPYITINYNGWDTHKRHFEIMNRKLPEMDQGMSALLEDLDQRGLLDSTIVWWIGEVGRSPKVQWKAPWNGGRGHHGACFSSVVAGGGFKGGHVVGASDARGEDVNDRPVSPRDLIGTMYGLLGIDPDGPLPNPAGLEVPVLPAVGKNKNTGGRLTEIV